MNDTRLWIAVVAFTAFLAGAAAGVFFGRTRALEPTSGWGAYADWLGDEFDLEPERRNRLVDVLAQYAEELKDRRLVYEARIQAQFEPELRELAAEYQGYIRNVVLPPSQRARYDELSEPRDLVAVHD